MWPACLLFVCFCIGIYAILMKQGVQYVAFFRRPVWKISAQTPHPSPLPTEDPFPARIASDPKLAEAVPERININTATADELQALPGIGAVISEAIVEYRESIGGFHYLEELLSVPGIGEKRFESIRELVCCPTPTSVPLQTHAPEENGVFSIN